MKTTTTTNLEHLWNNIDHKFTAGEQSLFNNHIKIIIDPDNDHNDLWQVMRNVIQQSPKCYKYSKEEFLNDFDLSVAQHKDGYARVLLISEK